MAGTDRINQNSAGNLLRVLLDLLPDVVYVKDRRSVFILANAALARQLGASDPTDVLGRTDQDFWPKPIADRFRMVEEHLMASGEPGLEMEDHLVDGQGIERWFQSSKVPLRSAEGRVVGLVGIGRDITDRKRVEVALRDANQALEERVRSRTAELERAMGALARSEALYRDVVNHVDEYIYAVTLGRDGRMLESFHSPASERITGWDPQSFTEDDSLWYRLIFRDDQQDVLHHLEALRRDLTPMRVEHRLHHRDGTLRWVRNVCVARRTSEGNVILSGFVLDITTDRRLREELVSAREAAVAADKAKSQFLASVSHEIRTPMNGILGMSEMLLRSAMPSEAREWVGTIHASGQALLGIIEELLDFARIEAGAPSVHPSPCDLRAATEEALELLALRAEGKGLELSLRWRAPSRFVADALRIRQVLLNLVGNAVKFTARGSVEVDADLVADRLRITVRDTGAGLSPEQIERLFQPYVQANQVVGRTLGGTGLGLAISKRLVELMGGSVGVDSQPGKGSRFWCELPLAAGPDHTPERNPILPAKRRVLVGLPPGRLATILGEQLTDLGQVVSTAEPVRLGEALASAAAAGAPVEVVVAEAAPPSGTWPEPDWIRLVAFSQGAAPPPSERRAGATLARPVRLSRLAAALGGENRSGGTQVFTSPPGVMPGTGLSALVVDDDPANQRVASVMLRELGCQVTVAADGASGLALADARVFDLVLLDQNLPDGEGTDVARTLRLRDAGRGTRPAIVGYTAGRVESVRDRCLEAGMDEVLAKPVSLASLAALLRRLLPGRGSEVTLARAEEVAETPVASTIDRSVVARHLALKGGRQLVQQLVAFWQTDARALLPAIREAAFAGDQRRLSQTAHRLLGSARTLGLVQVMKALSAIEDGARAGQPSPSQGDLDRLGTLVEDGIRATQELGQEG